MNIDPNAYQNMVLVRAEMRSQETRKPDNPQVPESHLDDDDTMYEVTELLLDANRNLQKKVSYLEAELRSLKLEDRNGCDHCCAQKVATKVSVASGRMRRNCNYLDKDCFGKNPRKVSEDHQRS